MTPSTLQLAAQLRQVIFYHLDNDLTSNALFLAGRLHALDPRNPDSIHLLALCHKKLGQFKTAFDYCRSPALRGSHLGCAYVFAQCCLALDRYIDGIAALEKMRPAWEGKNNWNSHSESSRRHFPDAAAIYCLLGKLLHANRDVKRAVECYVEALKINPFMWDAFERLCESGTTIRPSNVFKISPEMAALLSNPNPGTLQNNSESHRLMSGALHSHPANSNPIALFPEADPFAPPKVTAEAPVSLGFSTTLPRSNSSRGPPMSNDYPLQSSSVETPTAPGPQEPPAVIRKPSATGLVTHNMEPPMAPMRRPRTLQTSGVDLNMGSSKPRLLSARGRGTGTSDDVESNDSAMVDPPIHHKRTVSGSIPQPTTASTAKSNDINIRRSRRLFNQIRPNAAKPPPPTSGPYTKDVHEPKKAKATGTKGRSSATSTVGRVVSGNRKLADGAENPVRETKQLGAMPETRLAGQKNISAEPFRDHESVQSLLDLLGKLGNGYYSLSRYQCHLALQHFNSVPLQQRDTPWVLAQIGKAQYEQNSYLEAEKTFARLRKIIPSRIADMEIYSTVLWHLKNDTELAFLSHELVDADRLSPEAWCSIGNSFSLQREHNHALKCFKRATQLDGKFAYAFTLQGHEHISNEEYDKAMSAYRRAVAADNRHYNGWYGLGKVYEKLGNFEMAEKHYRAAASINPTNAVLVCCIGVVLEKMKRPQAALAQYNHACDLQPVSTLSRYKKARTLLNLRRHHEALDELNILKDLAPDESNVHYMLGRTHARMANKPLAIKHYTIAMNLDPKAAPYLKEHMEGLDDEDNENAEDDDDGDEEMT